MKSQGLLAQDILTESLQQLYNCHNIAKSEVQAKLISLQITQLLQLLLHDQSNRTRDKDKEWLYYKVNLCTANVTFNLKIASKWLSLDKIV